MKDNRIEKLYDCITDVDDKFIQEALEKPETKLRKKAMWIKWTSIAACFVVVVISAVLYFPKSAKTETDSKPMANREHSDASAHTESKEYEKIDYKNLSIKDGEIWGKMNANGLSNSGDNDHPNLSIKPNLEGFQYAKNPDLYEPPKNGSYIMTDSLKAAVKKYGNKVTYRIHLDIYKDQNKLDSNSAKAQKWFNNLSKDFTIAYMDSYDGSVHSYDFYMDACSYEDLMALCKNKSEYGFILSLYSESNGDFSEQEQTSTQIFNATNNAK